MPCVPFERLSVPGRFKLDRGSCTPNINSLFQILNQNYVNGYMTSTIAWNLVDSWYKDLPLAGERESLMTANQPWSGHYELDTPIWVSAHTCQFTAPGWHYMRHGYGVGHLEKGGSIVSLVSPDVSQLTVVIETMSQEHSECIRPALPYYNVSAQNVTLQLMGSFVDVQEMEVWYTKLGFNGQGSLTFYKLPSIQVSKGQVQVSLGVDEIYTLTTVTTGKKGDYGTIPDSKPFPIDLFSFFESLNESSEAPYFSAQQGVFEIVSVNTWDKHLRQSVLEPPIPWCPQRPLLNATMALVGDFTWSEVEVRAEVIMVPVDGSGGVFVAARIDKAGCETYLARGLYFFLFPNDQLFLLTKDFAGNEVIVGGRNELIDKVDNTMELLVYKGRVSGKVNRTPLFNTTIPYDVPHNGFAGIGTDSFGYADWDFFGLRNASNPIGGKDYVLRFGRERRP
ncbi:hypothetical protein V1264_013550 [Littorina saxatilis]|uniref:Galactosylceramidase n=1 Tax=Littorina saxatilis TaxID=31220 RepID=A0AAN9BQU8_9CAEN